MSVVAQCERTIVHDVNVAIRRTIFTRSSHGQGTAGDDCYRSGTLDSQVTYRHIFVFDLQRTAYNDGRIGAGRNGCPVIRIIPLSVTRRIRKLIGSIDSQNASNCTSGIIGSRCQSSLNSYHSCFTDDQCTTRFVDCCTSTFFYRVRDSTIRCFRCCRKDYTFCIFVARCRSNRPIKIRCCLINGQRNGRILHIIVIFVFRSKPYSHVIINICIQSLICTIIIPRPGTITGTIKRYILCLCTISNLHVVHRFRRCRLTYIDRRIACGCSIPVRQGRSECHPTSVTVSGIQYLCTIIPCPFTCDYSIIRTLNGTARQFRSSQRITISDIRCCRACHY